MSDIEEPISHIEKLISAIEEPQGHIEAPHTIPA
jgi:hypothetical protein